MLNRLRLFTIVLTICLSLPRFAHHTPDSVYYINLARYFQGDIQQEQLLKPYAYRILIPLFSTLLPIDNLDISIALINVLATIAAYLVFITYMQQLGMSIVQVTVGTIILVVSFPTLNYASGVLTDPAGFFMFILSCYLLLRRKYLLLSVTACFGILVRESLLTVVLIAIIDIIFRYFYHPDVKQSWERVVSKLLIVSIPPVLTFLTLRFFLFPNVPTNFYWGISLQGFLRNITQPKIGWLTFPFTLFPPLLILLYGGFHNGSQPIREIPAMNKLLFFGISVVSIIYIMYSNCIATAYMSVRFVWPIYCALIPLSVISIQNTALFAKWLKPISYMILGNHAEEETHVDCRFAKNGD